MKEAAENESLMIRLINLLADAFPGRAILKGGMELRLLQCPRHTNDLDYIFIPFTSKTEIGNESELPGLDLKIRKAMIGVAEYLNNPS